jgi:hypothetical protein
MQQVWLQWSNCVLLLLLLLCLLLPLLPRLLPHLLLLLQVMCWQHVCIHALYLG